MTQSLKTDHPQISDDEDVLHQTLVRFCNDCRAAWSGEHPTLDILKHLNEGSISVKPQPLRSVHSSFPSTALFSGAKLHTIPIGKPHT
ncbi:MAG: hypothetical protein ACFCU8_19535 [Thermosynechococcaceae cyanobacterium]